MESRETAPEYVTGASLQSDVPMFRLRVPCSQLLSFPQWRWSVISAKSRYQYVVLQFAGFLCSYPSAERASMYEEAVLHDHVLCSLFIRAPHHSVCNLRVALHAAQLQQLNT